MINDLTIFYVGIIALQLQKRSLTSELVRLMKSFELTKSVR